MNDQKFLSPDEASRLMALYGFLVLDCLNPAKHTSFLERMMQDTHQSITNLLCGRPYKDPAYPYALSEGKWRDKIILKTN